MAGREGQEEEQSGDLDPVKTFKLNVHTTQFCNEDLVIRSEDFPDVRPGDVLQIHHEEETFSRLLLQVDSYQVRICFTVAILRSILNVYTPKITWPKQFPRIQFISRSL